MNTLLAFGKNGGTYTTKSAVDGIERINFYRRIHPYNMAIVAGLSTEEVLQPHMEARTAMLSQAAQATLLIFALGLAFSSDLLRETSAFRPGSERSGSRKLPCF